LLLLTRIARIALPRLRFAGIGLLLLPWGASLGGGALSR